MTMLGAILLNPPLTSGLATRRRVAAGSGALGYSEHDVANLCGIATADVVSLNVVARASDGWLGAREALSALVNEADDLLIGWGVSGLVGDARLQMARQVDWLRGAASQAGHAEWWTVGGYPRHPSRWHQYVSTKYGRASGSDFGERFVSVACRAPIVSPAATAG